MHKTTFRIMMLAAGLSMLLSCQKDNVPTLPDPTPAYHLTREVQHLNGGATASASYTNSTIGSEVKFYKDSVTLELHFVADTAHDEFYFQLKTGSTNEKWVNTYPIRQRPVKTGESFMSYLYHEEQYSARLFPGWLYAWQGSITLSAYDAKRKLVSGNYLITLNNVYDPVSGRHNDFCNIILSGTFTNMKFTEVQ